LESFQFVTSVATEIIEPP